MSVWAKWTDDAWMGQPAPPATWPHGPEAWRDRVRHEVWRIRQDRAQVEADRRHRARLATRAATARPAPSPAKRADVQPPPKPGHMGPNAWYSPALGWQTKALEERQVESHVNAEKGRRERQARKLRKAKKTVERSAAREHYEDVVAPIVEIARRTGVGVPTPVKPPELRSSTVKVGDEPLVYGPGSDHSFFRDLHLLTSYAMGAVPTASTRAGQAPGEVLDRLNRNQRQMAKLATTTDEARVLYRGFFAERTRPWQTTISDHSSDNFRRFIAGGVEHRDVSTASNSMGDFAPPVYLLQQFQLFRTAAAPVAAQGGQRPLPATGMKVTIPKFTSKVSVAVQATENTTIASSTPTATFESAPVLTLAGEVVISQQLLDRSGVDIDATLTEQAAREAGTLLDTRCISAISAGLPTANKISNAATTPSIGALWEDVAKGSMLMRTTEGTRLPPDALMIPPANLTWFQAQVDTQKRPIWLPTAGAAGSRNIDNGPYEGYSGYDILGARVFTDANLPITPDAKLLLGNFGRGLLVYTAAPIVNVFPETSAKSLSVVVNFRQYAALAVMYPAGFVSITSTTGAYPKTPTFTGA